MDVLTAVKRCMLLNLEIARRLGRPAEVGVEVAFLAEFNCPRLGIGDLRDLEAACRSRWTEWKRRRPLTKLAGSGSGDFQAAALIVRDQEIEARLERLAGELFGGVPSEALATHGTSDNFADEPEVHALYAEQDAIFVRLQTWALGRGHAPAGVRGRQRTPHDARQQG